MWFEKVLVPAILLVTSLSVAAHSSNLCPPDAFPTLFFENGVGDGHADGAFLRMYSDVQDLSGGDIDASQKTRYRYVYTFHNTGSSTIKINFSDLEVVQSPLTSAFQDFSLQLRPNHKETVEFSTRTPPTTLISPVNVALLDADNKRWRFVRFGTAPLYVPSRLSTPGELR